MSKIKKDVVSFKNRSKKTRRASGPLRNVVSFEEAIEGLYGELDSADVPFGPDVGLVSIGQQIKLARATKNITQSDLATAAGITQGALSAIERGKGSDGPTARTVLAICNALGLKIELVRRDVDVLAASAISASQPGLTREGDRPVEAVHSQLGQVASFGRDVGKGSARLFSTVERFGLAVRSTSTHWRRVLKSKDENGSGRNAYVV